MNTQKTPLVHKMILVMLVLIFGCLVLMMIYGRKQIENLRDTTARASLAGSSNETALRTPFPKMRSSRNLPSAKADVDPVRSAPAVDPGPAPAIDAPVVKQGPTIPPSAAVAEVPEGLAQPDGIVGRVVLVGTPPLEKVIRFDATCGAMHDAPATTRHYVVGPNGGLANVLVYISAGLEGKKFNPPTEPVLLDQKDCMYQPYVIGAMVNQPIQFKNSDPVLHNIHALPRVNGNNEFNFAQPVQDQIDERKFSKQEIFVKLKCEVHDWMFAYVGVVNNPYFAVTDTNGVFEIPSGLPAGRYEVTAVHLKAGRATQRITLKQNQPAVLNFKLPVNGGPLASRP